MNQSDFGVVPIEIIVPPVFVVTSLPMALSRALPESEIAVDVTVPVDILFVPVVTSFHHASAFDPVDSDFVSSFGLSAEAAAMIIFSGGADA